MNTTSVKQP